MTVSNVRQGASLDEAAGPAYTLGPLQAGLPCCVPEPLI